MSSIAPRRRRCLASLLGELSRVYVHGKKRGSYIALVYQVHKPEDGINVEKGAQLQYIMNGLGMCVNIFVHMDMHKIVVQCRYVQRFE